MRAWCRVVGAVFVSGLVLYACQSGQADVTVSAKAEASVVIETVKGPGGSKGLVNWTKQTVTIVAMGAPKAGSTSPGQKKLTAREAALAIAYRDLAATVSGIHVSASVTVRDCALESSVVKTDLDAFIKGAEILNDKEKWDRDDEVYTVVVMLPLSGSSDNSLMKVLVPHVDDVVKPIEERKPEPAPIVKPTPPPTPLPKPSGGPYTGLIIDCRGLGVKAAISPKVLRPDNSEVWGTVSAITQEAVNQNGIVGYLSTIEAAQQSPRAGSNPLIVRAIGKQGSFEANAVVSVEDARNILDANKEASNPKFLDSFHVVFVIDSKKASSGF